MKKSKAKTERAALIIVDVQNDFCPGGALPVPDGDKVVAPLNRMIRLFVSNGLPIFATCDWHPERTKHFAAYGGKWPPHCVKFTSGANFHKDLDVDSAEILLKGMGEDEDEKSYSGFGGTNFTGRSLDYLLKSVNIQKLFIGGLATDYCVKATVLDALKLGFEVYLLEDACRAVNIKPTDGANSIKEMKKAGAKIITTKKVLGK